LVTTIPGAATNPEPSTIPPQAGPNTLTVDGPAASKTARTAAFEGWGAGGSSCGGKVANTIGNPWEASTDSMRVNTDGTVGSDRVSCCRIAESRSPRSSVLLRLEAARVPTSHTANSIATMAITTPSASSTTPRCTRRATPATRHPAIWPTDPHTTTAITTTTSATSPAEDGSTCRAMTGAATTPTTSPAHSPPNDSSCRMAPVRHPCRAASTSTARIR
jgi:hypothetical protein